ncbi:hypothetical protein TetV_304 [Tetraselmis virus 1]|uniref:Uncharacterized protein n=1 Tax=Tetraselmis virus 1 TaxID=2060617 RepID=A0A2P0VNB1_9VIRU|nr:hypothetical protein QJ968_gp304 [Tetraselmis virus 1]AUF82396.1 hypothetical protein TetV_304 [Tetraselmis virus 1]
MDITKSCDIWELLGDESEKIFDESIEPSPKRVREDEVITPPPLKKIRIKVKGPTRPAPRPSHQPPPQPPPQPRSPPMEPIRRRQPPRMEPIRRRQPVPPSAEPVPRQPKEKRPLSPASSCSKMSDTSRYMHNHHRNTRTREQKFAWFVVCEYEKKYITADSGPWIDLMRSIGYGVKFDINEKGNKYVCDFIRLSDFHVASRDEILNALSKIK